MPIYRLQTTIAADSLLPRDGIVLTPHFDDHGLTTDPENLCQGLADGLDTILTAGTQQIVVRAYNATDDPPNFPQAEVIKNPGAATAANGPREVALCLSFFADQNRPTRRGRLYFPLCLTSSSFGNRPVSIQMSTVASLVPVLAGLGGADVDWVVFSRKLQEAHKVTNWFIDDEWDTVRSRGLRPTTRQAGTTSG